MKIKYFYTAFALGLICLLTVAAISAGNVKDPGKKTNKSVIKFTHAVHKEVTDCVTCHNNIPESTKFDKRMLPTKEICATCHDVNDEKNCKQCHYDNVNEPLILRTPEINFNHKFHLTDQKLACESCHKGMGEIAYSTDSPKSLPAMNICTDCHSSTSVASNQCSLCHQSTANLLPADHKEVSFVKMHKFAAEKEESQCKTCHDNNFCESCHASTTMITEKNGKRDFFVPYSPSKFIDNTKQQNITRVHDLNYRFTHGIDVKGKAVECQTCHQVETFCVDCHSSKGGDFALEGTTPVSHRMPNFVTIGVGSGGGQHAALARRDIERCSACHDVQGADPTCILCHVDNNGVKGTHPKTHPNGFRNEHGDWHSDAGSVCYTCHRDANAHPGGIKTIGFCGYCHH